MMDGSAIVIENQSVEYLYLSANLLAKTEMVRLLVESLVV